MAQAVEAVGIRNEHLGTIALLAYAILMLSMKTLAVERTEPEKRGPAAHRQSH